MQHELIQQNFRQAGAGFRAAFHRQPAGTGWRQAPDFLRCRIGKAAEVIRTIFLMAGALPDA